MNKCQPVQGHRMSALDRQMLAAAYVPVIALGILPIVARISRTSRRQRQAAPR